MKKSIWSFVALLAACWLGVSSCAKETEEVDQYADWQARNEHYIDSIAAVAEANLTGNWKRLLNYKLQTEMPADNIQLSYDNDQYVYMQVLEAGNEEGLTPLYTDSVTVFYRGSLIPLLNGETVVFDENYSGDLNTDIHEPTTFALQSSSGSDGLIVGWATALQNMKEGERVRLFIPSSLGYGTTTQSSIPAYSTLVFDLLLERVIHPKGLEGRSVSTSSEK